MGAHDALCGNELASTASLTNGKAPLLYAQLNSGETARGRRCPHTGHLYEVWAVTLFC